MVCRRTKYILAGCILGGVALGPNLWQALYTGCTVIILARLPSPDGSRVALIHESTCEGYMFADVVAGVDIASATPLGPPVDILGVDTGGAAGARPRAIWTAPDVLRVTVRVTALMKMLTRHAYGARVDLHFDPDDLAARAAILKERHDEPDPPGDSDHKQGYMIEIVDFALVKAHISILEGKLMFFRELDNEARRRLIDVQQRTEALRTIEADLRRRFAGTMMWKQRSGREYLYRRIGRIDKSLGPRSAETEAIYMTYVQGKTLVEQRANGLRTSLQGMARVNRALGIGRVPRLIGRILRALDRAGVLGDQVCVVGTNALFAYEAHVGIRFETDLLATDDIDLALDARRNLSLAAKLMPEGLLGLLQRIDHSFTALGENHFRAVNSAGLMVDLITPEPRNPMTVASKRHRRLGGKSDVDDIEAVEIPRLEMIVDAPRFASVTIAEDGLPVWISAPDPRWWAAHKLWLASERTREPIKRQRDQDQGYAVAAMLAKLWIEADLSDDRLASIPSMIRQNLRDVIAGSGETDLKAEAEW